MRKVLGSISLLVLLLNTLLTPLTYAGEYEEILEISGENASEEVYVEEDGDNEMAPEFSVEEKNGEEESDGENVENSSGNVVEEGSGEVFEVGSGEIEDLTGESVVWDTGAIVEELTGFIDELTGFSVELTGFSVELTGEMAVSIGTGEETEVEEINYNKEPILGEKTYDDVIVRVEALTGIFPEGTELVIKPIKWWNLSNLKDQLVEEKEEIKEDTRVVAFDITFIYSGEEVQPKEGEKVKVTFDYSNNEDLVEADNQENQEVKVYHIEDKDEEGNELEKGEENIVEVTNVEESEVEGIVVADGEKFSIYAIVVTSGNGLSVTYNLSGGYWIEDHSYNPKTVIYTGTKTTMLYRTPSKTGFMFMGWFDELGNRRKNGVVSDGMNVYAKWQEFGDLDIYILKNQSIRTHYTFMDRNMGATELYDKIYCNCGSTKCQDKDCDSQRTNYASYGYFYQWGNNYGFDSYAETNGALSNTSQGSKVDVTSYSWNKPYSSPIFAGTSNNDWVSGTYSNLWGGNESDVSHRQGPCPDGYHVPNQSERSEIKDKWGDGNYRDTLHSFHVDFLMPAGSYRKRGDRTVDTKAFLHYRYLTSTYKILFGDENNDNFTRNMITLEDKISNGYSVRCLKNETNTNSKVFDMLNIDLRGGEKAIISIVSGEVVSLQNPIRNISDEFRGWYKTSDYSGDPIGIGSGLSQGDHLYAKWCTDGLIDDGSSCVSAFVVTFDSNGGSDVPNQYINPGNKAIRPADPEKEGYSFGGWYYTGLETEFDFETSISSNITIYAKWNLVDYTINYNLNSGSVEVINPSRYTVESGDITLNNPTREGYAFKGWSGTNLTEPTKTVTISQGSTGNREYEAIWGNINIVTFDAESNGGTTETGTVEVANGGTLELNKYTATPTDSSYQFIGWSENPNSSVILQTDPVITSNKTLYAVFSKEISATFNANGNKLDNANDNISKSCTVYNKENNCNITTPTISNSITRTVVGYTTSQEGASSSNTGSNVQINISGGEVYYAQTMTPEKVLSGAVNGNHSELSSYNQVSCILTGVYNGEIQATSCEVFMPQITPHTNTQTVVGWNTTADSITNNSSFNTNTNKLTLTVGNTKQTWYAITKAPEVHLSMTYQKGTGVDSIGENSSGCIIESAYNGNPQATTCTVKAPTITVKLGYSEENKRWKKVGGDDEKSEGDTITLNKSENSITYEASTDINTYTIEYILNDGNVEVVNPTSYTVESIDFTLNNPTREGYIFEGWSGTDLSEKIKNVTIPGGSIGDRVYEANWKAIDYTITYNLNSGTVAVVNPVSYTIESGDISLNNPTRTGYTFEGWSGTNLLDKTINVTIRNGSTGDRAYEANWEANKYEVRYKANGGEGDDLAEEAIYDTKYVFTGNIFTREGYTFIEWNTKADGSGSGFAEGFSGIWKTATGVNLYAIWEINKYIVTYDAASHSGTINKQSTSGETVEYNTSIILPVSGIESQKGYEFTGWTTTLNGKEPISNTYTVTGDITFYPIFKKDGEQKDITFHKNGNSGYRYENHEYTEDRAFSGCSIPTLYNTDLYTGSCSVLITLPDIVAHENTPTVLGWSTGAEERTISYATGVDVIITIPRGKEVELYAQTRSVEKEYTATYETDLRVEGIEKPSDTCSVTVTYNGNPQQTVCTEAITLPNIVAKLGYNTPIWKLGDTEYNAGAQVYLSGNVIFTGTATPDAQTPYTVKHYYQIGDTDYYDFSGYDTLSGATETLLELSKLQKNPLENTGFTYYKARVNDNDESDDPIDIRNIDDFVEEAEIQPGLVIQLFYTRNNNTLTLNTIEHAIVEKSPTGDSYYYGEAITFSGHAEEGYTFSGWSIKEGGNAPQIILGSEINYTMPSTGVVVTPVIREHSYTIHFDGNGAVGNIADKSTLYSATVTLPTAEEVAGQLTNTGYSFVGWTTGATETTVLRDLSKATSDDNGEVTLYAKWVVNDGTQYLVKYYLEPVEEGKDYSEYVLQDTFTGAAPTNSVITGVLNNYDGFTTPLELTGKVAADGSLVINYYYPRNSYTYTFNAGEGAEFEDGTNSTGLSFRYEQSVNELELSVVKTGFTKIGWTPELPATMPHENKTSTVVWSENHYTIEYDANGGFGVTPTQSDIGYTDYILLTGNQFSKEGYHFVGWSITRDGDVKYSDTDEVNGLTGENNAVVVLYAQWEANFYTVTFDANSGDVAQIEKTVIYDATYGELPEASRVGYTFKGWYTDKVAGVEVTSGTKVIRTEDHTLYAQWTADTYTVTFNANGGAVSQTEKTVTYDETYGVMPTPTRVGYSFLGWYTEQTGGEKVTADTKVRIAISHTLYAHWTANKYIVTFNANGGAVSQSTGQVTYNQTYGVLPVPTREGYAFSGWYTQVEGGEYVTGTTTVTRTENHTLYAQWKANTYTVTFDANSGDVSEASRQVTFDEKYGVLPVATRTGYTFQGWYTEKDGGKYVTGTTTVTTASNHTLYAHWLENHYTIEFNVNGGVGEMSPMTNIQYTEEVSLAANAFTRDGYQFNGWSITPDGVKVYDDEQDVTKLTGENNATVTLYAVWQKGAYNITYDLNGGALTGGKTNPVGYDVDTETFILNNPERDGYDFLGWSGTEIGGLSGEVTIAKGSIGDREYEANWKPTEYTITYNLSGGELPSGQINPVTYTIESGDITLINPVRTGYDFNGWSGTAIEGTGETVTITHGSTGDRVYEANWKIKKYTITWENSTGVILKQEILPYGVTPDYGGIPTSGADAQYTYTFKSWDPVLAPVTEDQVYTATYNKTLNTYIITFKNEDGTVLYTTGVAYGNTPVFSGTDPQKAADAQYTYTFNGWDPALAPVTGEATYTATYTHTINKYTITFVDENGSELKAGVKYDYGTVSGDIAQPDEPIKTGDAHYSYTFKGWNPELTGVTKDQVYTAVYDQTINSYPITFYDEDGTTILQGPTLYPYGTLTGVIVPVFTPTKTSDGTYTYEFDKWTPTLETVVGTANYTATYKSTYIDYQVIFLDSTGAVLMSGYYHSGDNVVIPTGPAKASTTQTGYTFKSWYPEVQVVTGDITYEPTYTETTRSYTIKWLSSTGFELRKETLPYGSIPDYGENPTSGSTAEYDYVFKSWEPAIQAVTGDATYKATYTAHKRSYTITWNDEDGTELGTTTVEYGEVPVQPTIPTKDPTEQTGYLFNGWTPSLVAVTGPKTYTATYQEYLMRYTILWRDWDGEVLKTGENIPYGTLIVNNKPSTNPSRESTAQTGYTFNDWYDGDGVQLINSKKLTGDAEYTARYDEETRSYTIIWKDRNGTELEKDENVLYGTNPVYDSNEPTSGSTAQYVYTFNGWSPGVHSVTGPEVYTAVYKNTLRSYPITFYDEDGITVVKPSTMYPYGTPGTTYKPVTNPTKEGYSFEKWIPELETVVGTADYKASYKINSYKVTPVKGVGVADIIGGGTYEYNTVVTLTGYAKAGYHFEGGETVKGFNVTVPANSISVKITAIPNTYYVRYNPGDGTGVMLDQEFLYDQEKELNANTYTNEGLYFKEWTDGVGHQYKNKAKVKNLATTGVVDLFAIWTDTPEPIPPTPTPTPTPGESAAGGGRIIPTVDEVEHESADLQTGAIVQTGEDTQGETGGTITRTEEEMDAYKYAYKYHITTLAPREAAMPDDYVQRGHMAKMVVNYSINVLHRELPDKIPNHCKWKDSADSWGSQEIIDYAEKACALGLMGIDMDYFQPNKYVTRAQFGTIFGRLLRGKLPSTPYYAAHLAGLKERGIMTQIENPEDRIEIRKWAWLMFMRSEKYFNI